VAQALGLALTPDPMSRVRQVCQATAANRSSMLQDVLAQRPTEIAAISGQIVAHGQKLQIPTPVNALLTDLVQALESGYAAGEKGKEEEKPAFSPQSR
jgi:2-dehydropantoate 2-reductase